MFPGTALFIVVIALIAPQSRALLGACLAGAMGFINAWAPYSYFLLLLLAVAMLGAVIVLKTWPKTPEPDNPMAKYKKEIPYED